MKIFTKYNMVLIAAGLLLCLTLTANAQYRILYHFKGGADDGSQPCGSLFKFGSTFYGVTAAGGMINAGTVFKINTDGTDFLLLHSFMGGTNDGVFPRGSLINLGTTLYGATLNGGSGGGGTIFKINTDGTDFGLFHAFTGTADYQGPYGDLIESDSIFYGTARGGNNDGGNVFRINVDGTNFQILHTFTGGSDGWWPHCTLFKSGQTLFGLTNSNGNSGWGMVFRINTDGSGYQKIHQFVGGTNDGALGYASTFVQSGSKLYGMTAMGGRDNTGTIFQLNPDGTQFRVLHSFNGGTNDGEGSFGSLMLSDTMLYGMTVEGGAGGLGTIFQMSTNGNGFKLLHSFSGGINDGSTPWGALILSDSVLYGMTSLGGSQNKGVIFAMDLRGTTGVHEETGGGTIENFRLEQNYPNPFNPTTVIGYQLPVAGNVKLTIYNVLGQKIKTLVNGFQSAREHSLVWDGTDDNSNPVSSGIYFYKLETYNHTLQKKMMVLR